MKLSAVSLADQAGWRAAGCTLGSFDRHAVLARTRSAPEWVHFGAGNIFRAFPAVVQQRLLDAGRVETGIIVAEGFDYEIIEKAYRPYDDLSLLVVLKADGSIEKRVIASVVESLMADSLHADWQRLLAVFRAPSLQMVSFTITEKGYSLVNAAGRPLPDVEYDLAHGPEAPRNIMAKVTALCLERFRHGATPIALVSMDNCSHNGAKLFDAVHRVAKAWVAGGFVDATFLSYLETPAAVSFPWSMIDKITPRPDESVCRMLTSAGFESTEIIVTSKQTYTAPFVNAEEKEYLIVEDAFPNGRPPLEEAGVVFTSRDTVDRVEKMKVCTCLNPLHTALAVYGCLLGYTSIHKEMHDPELRALVEKLGYEEGLPVVVHPGILKPEDFLREVLNIRFPNPFMPDTPQRIASDTSQKLPIRFGETLKAYRARPDLDVRSLRFIPLVFAGWCRYLMAIDDTGKAFEPSPDPLLAKLRAYVNGIELGASGPFQAALKPLLSDATIFGVDLYEAGLGGRVEGYFAELVSGPGAVRRTLQKYLSPKDG